MEFLAVIIIIGLVLWWMGEVKIVMTREERIKDIKEHPDKHKHSFAELIKCCWFEGAIHELLMRAHRFPGSRCDVTKGACSCGGRH